MIYHASGLVEDLLALNFKGPGCTLCTQMYGEKTDLSIH